MSLASELKYNEQGLISVIIQDAKNNDVLMLGWMNQEAVERTLKGPFVTFWSRSRQKFWVKGEESGHTQEVKEIFYDCDKDCLLIKVHQKVAACHDGYRSCFYRKIENGETKVIGTPAVNPKEVYKK